MNRSKRICVYCGAQAGRDASFAKAAREFGVAVARAGLGIVYGGGRIGMMGELADAALGADGEVLGVIPRSLTTSEVAHSGLSELFIVNTMHERKAMMAHLSSAFAILPGGFGTLEEMMEILTWRQLGLHDKPIGILNVDDYFGPLFEFFDHAKTTGFIQSHHLDLMVRSDDAGALVSELSSGLESYCSMPS